MDEALYLSNDCNLSMNVSRALFVSSLNFSGCTRLLGPGSLVDVLDRSLSAIAML